MAISERLSDLVTPVLEENGFRLWEVKVTKAGKRSVVSVLLDKEGGATADDLAEMSKTIAPVLDEDPSLEDAYHLEVATPGLERNLSTSQHFLWSVGMEVTIAYRVAGSINRVTGTLTGFEDNNAIVKSNSPEEGTITISLDAITKAHTIFDFQAAMKKADEEEFIPQGETA